MLLVEALVGLEAEGIRLFKRKGIGEGYNLRAEHVIRAITIVARTTTIVR